jgi:hypothetical protein
VGIEALSGDDALLGVVLSPDADMAARCMAQYIDQSCEVPVNADMLVGMTFMATFAGARDLPTDDMSTLIKFLTNRLHSS